MKTIQFTPQGVCSSQMIISVTDDNIIRDVRIIGGCPGNTLGLSRILIGMKADEAVKRLSAFAVVSSPLRAQTS